MNPIATYGVHTLRLAGFYSQSYKYYFHTVSLSKDIEIDGNLLPPNVLSKLEIFMLNVMRFKGHADINSIIEHEGIQSVAINRKIIR